MPSRSILPSGDTDIEGKAMGAERKIIHLDLDAFFCAVEELREPALKGKPFAVGGRPEQRGVVASCSYPARRFGVRSAMPMAKALRLCPDLLVLPHHFPAYRDASQQVMERLRALTSLVEQVSIDEAFLDVSGLSEPVEELAIRLGTSIREKLSLPCSLGVATNKLVAKIATDVGKLRAREAGVSGSPNALTVVPAGTEAEFLAPLPVEALWGVGPKTAARLAELDIYTIGDLANQPGEELGKRFGKMGWELAERARGIDERPVVTQHETKSVSQETTFARDVRDTKTIHATLRSQSERVASGLQREGLHASTIRIKIRWPDFTTLTRQVTLSQPANEPETIYRAAEGLLSKVWQPGKPVRLLGVGASGLTPRPMQLQFNLDD
jgi:DNA polymerase IV